MKKNILFLLFILSFILFPKSAYAYSIQVDSSTKFSDFTTNDMVEYYTSLYNCDNFVLYENASYYYFLPLYDTSYAYVKTSNNNLQSGIFFTSMTQPLNTYYTFRTTKSSLVERYPVPSNNYTTAYFSNSSYTMIYSTLDIPNFDDNTTWFTKNYDYTPASCEECEECENMTFPITKEEYYVLLVLVSVLIMIIFFKWCFPMNRRK